MRVKYLFRNSIHKNTNLASVLPSVDYSFDGCYISSSFKPLVGYKASSRESLHSYQANEHGDM